MMQDASRQGSHTVLQYIRWGLLKQVPARQQAVSVASAAFIRLRAEWGATSIASIDDSSASLNTDMAALLLLLVSIPKLYSEWWLNIFKGWEFIYEETKWHTSLNQTRTVDLCFLTGCLHPKPSITETSLSSENCRTMPLLIGNSFLAQELRMQIQV